MQVLGHHYSRGMPSQIEEILRRVDGYPRVADDDEEEMEQVD